MVEILHIDTEDSRSLTKDLSAREKSEAQRLLRDAFIEVCTKTGGQLHHWAGDGGFALFPTSAETGYAVRSAEQFLQKLPHLNAQTARALERPSFLRRIRIKAHRGEVYLTGESGIDSGAAKDFDDFIKHERRFAPHTDEIFITDQLHKVLLQHDRNKFELFKKSMVAGKLATCLYRLKKAPVPHSADIFKRGDELGSITESDWRYLRERILAHFLNVAARNQITKGLIQHLASRSGAGGSSLSSETLLDLTLDALFNFLQESFLNRRTRVSYWRAVQAGGVTRLKMVAYRYPAGEQTNTDARDVAAADIGYKVCEAFANIEPVATPSVNAARLAGKWKDFDAKQPSQKRSLASALQIPIFCLKADGTKEPKGVLSLDSDQPDMFLFEEVELWRDELVGFLVNLALAEKLRECNA